MSVDNEKLMPLREILKKGKNEHGKTIAERRHPASIEGRRAHHAHVGVVPYDKNLTNYPKETKKLLELCKKACERIAKEVA